MKYGKILVMLFLVAAANAFPQLYFPTFPGARPDIPVFSPDGSKVAYVSDGFGCYYINIVNADGSQNKKYFLPFYVSSRLYFSPDGSKIACIGTDVYYGISNIFLLDVGDRYEKRVTAYGENSVEQERWDSRGGPPLFNNRLTFSPDGRRIFYGSRESGSKSIFAINVDGSGRKALTTGWYYAASPEFYADGSKIVFDGKYTAGPHGSSIYTMDTDGSDLKPFGAKEVLSLWQFSVSPTGDKFVIEGIISGEPQCRYAIFNADGSGMVRLLSGE